MHPGFQSPPSPEGGPVQKRLPLPTRVRCSDVLSVRPAGPPVSRVHEATPNLSHSVCRRPVFFTWLGEPVRRLVHMRHTELPLLSVTLSAIVTASSPQDGARHFSLIRAVGPAHAASHGHQSPRAQSTTCFGTRLKTRVRSWRRRP